MKKLYHLLCNLDKNNIIIIIIIYLLFIYYFIKFENSINFCFFFQIKAFNLF